MCRGRPAAGWCSAASRFADTAAEVDAITGTTGNLAEQPSFVDVTQPLLHGLQLARTPARAGQALSGQRDMLGRVPNPSDSFFGAYFTSPGL